jgi:hypothetical protein
MSIHFFFNLRSLFAGYANGKAEKEGVSQKTCLSNIINKLSGRKVR